jgi:hypothetical protein
MHMAYHCLSRYDHSGGNYSANTSLFYSNTSIYSSSLQGYLHRPVFVLMTVSTHYSQALRKT